MAHNRNGIDPGNRNLLGRGISDALHRTDRFTGASRIAESGTGDYPSQLLRVPDISARTTLSEPTLNRRISAGDFPRGMLNGGCRTWHKRTVDSWSLTRVAFRDDPGAFSTPPYYTLWTPEHERADVPEIRFVSCSSAMEMVRIARTTLHIRAMSGKWTVSAALRKMQREGLSYVPLPASVVLTVGRVAWLVSELQEYVELCPVVLGPDGPDLAAVSSIVAGRSAPLPGAD